MKMLFCRNVVVSKINLALTSLYVRRRSAEYSLNLGMSDLLIMTNNFQTVLNIIASYGRSVFAFTCN